MKMAKIQVVIIVFFLGFLTHIATASTFSFDTIISFGDSLSDDGNLNKRFTDGPLWNELLAAPDGTLHSFAYGGATTGYDNPAALLPVTGLQWQVGTYSSFVGSSDDPLLTVWAGANDFLQGRDFNGAVININLVLEDLYAAGGRNFLVPNLPDIGKAPSMLGNTMASSWSQSFNDNLDTMLERFNDSHDDIMLYFVDTFSIFNSFTPGTQEYDDLFWIDGFHPSLYGHELIFEAAVEALTPVPEPTTFALFGMGLVILLGVRSRKKEM